MLREIKPEPEGEGVRVANAVGGLAYLKLCLNFKGVVPVLLLNFLKNLVLLEKPHSVIMVSMGFVVFSSSSIALSIRQFITYSVKLTPVYSLNCELK